MSKFRIIPIILIDGINVLKGTRFNSWRPIGSILPALNIFEKREVDELILIDVNATKENRCIDSEIILQASKILSIPLTVGGGIKSLKDIEVVLKSGADKVIIGAQSITNPELIINASDNFGSQSIICSVDIKTDEPEFVYINSGTTKITKNPSDQAKELIDSGAGEILIQAIDKDGTMEGMNLEIPFQIKLENPFASILISGGFSNQSELDEIYLKGFSGIGVGALFQFTEVTPNNLRNYMLNKGYKTRTL